MAGSLNQRTAVVLDPHPLWLGAVASVLGTIDVTVVGSSIVAEQALELIEQHQADILVIETHALTGELSGYDVIRKARESVAAIRVIVLSASNEPVDIDAAFDAGAQAYVIKTAVPEDLAATIRQAFEHSVFLARTHGRPLSEAPQHLPGTAAAVADASSGGLTRREREILALVAEGHSNRELARILWVTEQTVKFHLSNIYRKLGVSNRTEASRWAHRNGLISPVPSSVSESYV